MSCSTSGRDAEFGLHVADQNDMSSVSSTFSPEDGSSSRISFGSEHSAPRELDHLRTP